MGAAARRKMGSAAEHGMTIADRVSLNQLSFIVFALTISLFNKRKADWKGGARAVSDQIALHAGELLLVDRP